MNAIKLVTKLLDETEPLDSLEGVPEQPAPEPDLDSLEGVPEQPKLKPKPKPKPERTRYPSVRRLPWPKGDKPSNITEQKVIALLERRGYAFKSHVYDWRSGYLKTGKTQIPSATGRPVKQAFVRIRVSQASEGTGKRDEKQELVAVSIDAGLINDAGRMSHFQWIKPSGLIAYPGTPFSLVTSMVNVGDRFLANCAARKYATSREAAQGFYSLYAPVGQQIEAITKRYERWKTVYEAQSIVNNLVEEGIEQDLLAASKKIKHCGDYGCLYYHPGKHEVHWTAGDADGPPEGTSSDEIIKLLKLPGIKHVEIGDEWSPDEDEGWKRLNEAELPPEEPLDPRSEIDRLLPTKTYTLAGNSMIHAPGVIRMAQNEWRNGRKKQKAWAMGVIHAWEGLPEEVYLAILNDKVDIQTEGDNAVITVKQY